MEKLATPGRLLFALAIAAFGVEHLVCARFKGDALPVIPWVPANPVLAYLVGTGLVAAGLSIALLKFKPRLAALLLGVFFLVCLLVLHVPDAVARPPDIGTLALFEPLALGGAALALAESLPPAWSLPAPWARILDGFYASGRYLFAASLVVFGISHFVVTGFIVSVIPPWFPGARFWAYFTGTALIAAGISLAKGWMDRLAATLLGTMFLLWFLFLHTPRVMSASGLHNPDEWSSAFIALGMCGASWSMVRGRLSSSQRG